MAFTFQTPPSAKTLTAIDRSIAKWEGVVTGHISDQGSVNCALCKMFLDEWCQGCPVAEAVDVGFCKNTPYKDWEGASNEDGIVTDETRPLAQAELDFLRQIRADYAAYLDQHQKSGATPCQ